MFLTDRLESSSEDSMVSLSRIMVQDHKHHIAGQRQGVDALHIRASANIEEHYANFAAYLCEMLEGKSNSVFLSLNQITCHVCRRTIMADRKTYMQVQSAQNCRMCHMGAFDICFECFSGGARCLDSKHTIRPRNLQGFWYQFHSDAYEKLEKIAAKGVADEWATAAGASFDRRSAFSTMQDLIGMCPLVVAPSDVVVILFGGRTPYILRRTGDHYRLVSDCYVHGMMDGEGIKMWQAGQLNLQDFELR
jgi:hypothetical protein